MLTLDENPDESQEADTKKDGIPDRGPTPAREAERSEIRGALQDGLASLTPSQRAVLEQYAKGVSFAEVARETGASEQAVISTQLWPNYGGKLNACCFVKDMMR